MKKTKILMGMPVTIEVVDESVSMADIDEIYAYFNYVDQKFSTYKKTSEISAINSGKLKVADCSPDMKLVFRLSEKTRQETDGFFNIKRGDGYCDPSGLVKGWAIWQAAKLLKSRGFKNFYIDAGGDIQAVGKNSLGRPWTVGIRNPFKLDEIIKIVQPNGRGVATSGTYERGDHIYNPFNKGKINGIVSLTVIGPNIYEADRFATAAFAMGSEGINFVERLPGFEGYMVDAGGTAILTSGFERYLA